MPRHSRQLADSAVYHVMARGVNRDAIFLDNEDYERYLYALQLTKDVSNCAVLAYCLMPNHVHLVIRAVDEPLALVMKRLGVRYAGWFNRKYGRVGHLFQDRFRSRPVESDEYLFALVRYVWDNPVQAGLSGRPEDYRWSSRRLLERKSSLVDDAALKSLMMDGGLTEIAAGHLRASAEIDLLHTRPPRHTPDEVVELLQRSCGTANPDGFRHLPLPTRRRVIRELRMRGVRYAQIASATGMSKSGVLKLHATEGPPAGTFG
ncbi:MAG: transposase [Micropruina sp.]|uniref:transposase n=1 Tax=Micropruina sp. TaxID=2737536 RepID=UPI0039E53A9D